MNIKLTEGVLCQVRSLFILNYNSNLKNHFIDAVSKAGPFIYIGESIKGANETYRFYSLSNKKTYSLWQDSLNKYYALEIIL